MLNPVVEALRPIAEINIESQVLICIKLSYLISYESADIPFCLGLSVLKSNHPITSFQVLYHTPKSSYSYFDDKLGGNFLSMGDIPFFVCA
jgi:GPI-anchor transamidase subunit S